MDFDIFDKNTTNKARNQNTSYYATSNNLCTCAFALPGKTGNMKIAFFTDRINALPESIQSVLDFFNLSD